MPNRYPANLGSTAWFLQLSGTLLLACTDLIALVVISLARYMNFAQKRPANYLEQVIIIFYEIGGAIIPKIDVKLP